MMWADLCEDEVYVCKHDTAVLDSIEVKYDVLLQWELL